MTLARRLPAWALLGLLGSTLVVSGQAIRVLAADPDFPVGLTGAGDSDVMGEMIDWQDSLFAADQPSDVQYFQRGSRDGRSQLLRGKADFSIDGVGFTPAELAARPADAGEILTVPLSVGSTTIAVGEPAQVGWGTYVLPCTIDEYNEGLCDYVAGPPIETIRIPPESLSALITGQSERRLWSDSDFAAALGTSTLWIQRTPKSHTFLNRTEGATQNKYLMEYARALGPQAWAETLAFNPGFAWEPIGEVFSPRTPSKFGLDTQLGFMSQPNDPVSNAAGDRWSGNMGPVPTTLYQDLLVDFPARNYKVAEIQNANGDWVTPTRESLDAALAAGLDPIIATNQSIPNAYPLVFINNLYTVAGTLSPDKANSLAAFVRYVATDGQALVIADGGTDLPESLQSEALAMADEIVVKNCTSADFEVTTSGPSSFETATPQVQALTSMKHCTLKPPPPTTTTTTTTSTTVAPTSTTTTTTIAPPTPVIVASSANPSTRTVPVATTPPPIVGSATTTTAPPTTTTTAAVATTTTTITPAGGGGASRPRGVALSQLPLVKPRTGAEEATRLGTFMLGAALFLLVRRLAQLRAAAAA